MTSIQTFNIHVHRFRLYYDKHHFDPSILQIIFERLGTTAMVEQETKKFNSLEKWIRGINSAKNKTCGSDT